MTETLHQATDSNPAGRANPRGSSYVLIGLLSEDVKYMTIFDSESTPT